MLSIGYAVTVLAAYVKFTFKISDFYSVKPYTFVKLTNLATISKKTFLDRHTYIHICTYIYIYIYIYITYVYINMYYILYVLYIYYIYMYNCLRGKLPPRIIAPRTIAPEHNCPRGKLAPRKIASSP